MEWTREHGYAEEEDLRRTEEGGRMAGARASAVSERAIERGYKQVGTLGSGNHYLEIQVSDKQLACAPFRSREGQDYFAAMQCAVNMAFANRQLILHRICEVFRDVFGRPADELGLTQVYDVTHNTAKVERHPVEGEERELLVHRKGATRAFAPRMPGLPPEYAQIGQPVIIGGSMETGSYLLLGTPKGRQTFYTTAHGSGRLLGRRQAKKRFNADDIDLSAPDAEQLLFTLLGELIFYKDAENLLLSLDTPEIHNDESGYHLKGRASGSRIDPKPQQLGSDVKAVTLYQFRVEQTGGGRWFTRVVFDT